MSPLWNRSAYRLYLAPDHLAWAKMEGLFRPSLTAQGALPFPGTVAATLTQNLADSLARLPEADTPVASLILSDAWLHYAVVDWPEGVTRKQELALYAEAVFADMHDPAPGGQLLLWRATDIRQRLFLCGIDRALLDVIQNAFTRQRRLPTILPLFPALHDALPNAMAEEYRQLLVLESERLTLALRKNGQWQSITSLGLKQRTLETVATRIRQEQRAAGIDSSTPLNTLRLGGTLTIQDLQQEGLKTFDLQSQLSNRPDLLALTSLLGGGKA